MSKQTYIAWGITLLSLGAALFLKRRGQKYNSNNTPTLIDNNTMNNYFADKEFYASNTAQELGINNMPDANAWQNLHALRDNILNPARYALGSPIYITSGYRCPKLNTAVGGASNSQHITGEAADITAKSIALNRELFRILVQLGNFDQLIWEKGGEWIHVSYRSNGLNRGEMLAYNGNSYTRINNNWQIAIV